MNEQRLLDSIRENEGYRAEPYRDSMGKWTVGVGHLLEDEPIRLFMPLGSVGALLSKLTKRETHDQWLLEDVQTAISDAERWLGFMFKELSDARQEVVVEAAFQLGYSRLSTFVKFRAAIADQDWDAAVHEMRDSEWARQTPGRVLELSDRFLAG